MIEAPAELAARAQWVAWRYVQREGEPKPTKVPLNARSGTAASTTDPATWSTYQEANAFLMRGGHASGIGYVLSEDDPYTGVDLDHCREPEHGAIDVWAKAIVRRLSSYTEISPSGTGLRIFVIGELPPHGRHKGQIEVYCRARFLTITGDRYYAAPGTIQRRQEELQAWHREVFGDGKPKQPNGHAPLVPSSLADTELLVKAQTANNKFVALWNGDYSGYESQSEADLALANYLAFWAGPDPSRIDALFRMSGLNREKWEERDDYRAWTIGRALEGRSDFYDPHYRSNPGIAFGIGGATGVPDPVPSLSELESWTEIQRMELSAEPCLVDGLVWKGKTHWWYSSPGGGKTLLAITVGLHVAAGQAFCGLESQQGCVLMIEEDSSRMVIQEYVQTLEEIYELGTPTLPFYFRTMSGLRITQPEHVAYVRGLIAQMPVKPVLVIIDACERIVPSSEFNSKELDSLGQLLALNLKDGIANIVIDHTRKSQLAAGEKPEPVDQLYGGRSKSAIADVMMYLSGRIDKDAQISFPKFRGAEPGIMQIRFDGDEGFTLKVNPPRLVESDQAVQKVINNAFGKALTREEIDILASLKPRTTQRALERLMKRGWIECSEEYPPRYRASTKSGGIFK